MENTMDKKEVLAAIDNLTQSIPRRLTGNQGNTTLVARMAGLVQTDREALIDVLRDWLAVRIPASERKPEDGMREAEMWVALEAIAKYHLIELKQDVERLISDIHSGKTYRPHYEDAVWHYYNEIRRDKDNPK